ncbi:Seven TM Receptor [Aphelenchoides besseyi]|nr:Seven TM Receptor [Aphelenchoides besseyi]
MLLYYGLQVAIYTADILALIFNSLLLHLIYTETNNELREYKNVLILNCIIDYTCTALNLFNGAHFEIVDGLWIHAFTGPAKWFPRSFHYAFVGSYSFTLCWAIVSLPIPFAFRWRLVCRNQKTQVVDLMKWGSTTFGIGCLFLMIFGYGFYLSAHWNSRDHSFLNNNPFLFPYPNATPTLVIGELNSTPMLLIILMSITMEPGLCILIVYFSYEVYVELNKMRDRLRPKTRRLQKQMNRMLFAQAFLLFAGALIPLFVLLILMILKFNLVGVGSIITLSLNFIPLLNPMSVLVLTTNNSVIVHFVLPIRQIDYKR